jgi:transcriptional regulator with XRE-family HTH domain
MMMAYSTEQMAMDLKTARIAKGLSQRALSKRAGVPQSHISKIENGGVDLRVSSLVEIARALDLEVTLVPRKNISAVRSITRPRLFVAKEMEAAAKVSTEFQRLQDTIAKITHENPAMKEIAQLRRRVNDLGRLKLPPSALDDIKKINDSLKLPASESDTLRRITDSLNQIQNLRNQLAYGHIDLPKLEKIRPAYSLEEEEDDDG